jgi:chitodextrinase
VTGTAHTDTGLSPGTAYAYQVVAFDAAGNVSTAATASATTLATDTVAPSAPGNLTGTEAKGKKVVLAWSASSDNVGVARYRVFRNGAQVATTAGTGYTDALGGRATVTYYVLAYDAAGNVSPASNSISVRA